jgi:hypothetical protein
MTHRATMYPGYDVGYGRPPWRTRFQKGQSGNPGGRKRGMTEERAKRLALRKGGKYDELRRIFSIPWFFPCI